MHCENSCHWNLIGARQYIFGSFLQSFLCNFRRCYTNLPRPLRQLCFLVKRVSVVSKRSCCVIPSWLVSSWKTPSYVGYGPNIIGSISVSRRLNAPVSGAFNSAVDGSGDGAAKSSTGMGKFDSTISFNAAYGGGWGIYGASNTVQPPAFQTLIIIKIWKVGGWTVWDDPYTGELLDADICKFGQYTSPAVWPP